MLPIRLQIKGIYSYQTLQEIDFTQLTAAGLFGIFGQVGSGKSTILEAIGFALYGRTERLGERDNRNYNMLNLKSDELLIDFEFENYDGVHYRFVVSGKRNKKVFEEVKTLTRNAYKKIEEEWLPLNTTDAAEILDLSYDNFRRTIIIPQGKFQEFLQLGAKDRTQMMMEIFKLHRFDLQAPVSKLEVENNLHISNTEGQLQSYDDVNEERGASLEQEIVQHNLKLVEATERVNNLKEELQKITTIKQYADNVADLEGRAATHSEGAHLIRERQVFLQKYELAQREFMLPLSQVKSLRDGIARKQDELISLQKESGVAVEDSNVKRQELALVNVDFSKMGEWRKIVQDYTFAKIFIREKKVAASKEDSISKGNILLQGEQELLTQLLSEEESLQKELQVLQAEQVDSFLLLDIDKWFLQKETLKKQEGSEIENIHRIENQLTAIRQQLLEYGFETIEFQIELEEKLEILSKQQTEVNFKIQQLQLQQGLASFADHLHNGEPCPLCGALEHPAPLANVADKDMLLAANVALDTLKQQENKFRNVVTTMIAKYYAQQNELYSCKNKLDEISKDISQHERSFQWSEFDKNDLQAFHAFKEKIKKNIKDSKAIDERLTALRSMLNEKKNTVDKYERLLLERQSELDNARNNQSGAMRNISVLAISDFEQHTVEELEKNERALIEKINSTQDRHEQLKEVLANMDTKIAAIGSKLSYLENRLNKDNNTLHQIEGEFSALLQQSEFESVAEISATLNTNIDIISERRAIEEYSQTKFSIEEQLKNARILLGDNIFDQAKYEAVLSDYQLAIEAQDLFKGELAVMEGTIKILREKLHKKKVLIAQLEGQKNRESNLKTLKNLFIGGGFVNYVSSIYLQTLCRAANERFMRLTKQQLRLEMNDKNEFIVCDLINGGRKRSVRTLSGGQTFQASLSLALALADSVQSQNKSKQNFFFLDEGFGSLDKDALSSVFDALKSLRKENRIVGIISHVEELQQEIPLSLKITNDVELGSQIALMA